MQYSETIWRPVGNLIETIPISISSFSLAYINIYQLLIKNRGKCLFFSGAFLYLISYCNVFSKIKGFSSSGFQKIFLSFFAFSFFSLIPLEILNEKLLIIIRQITKFTQGIYCMHFLFQYYMKKILDKNGSLIGCIILYIISYFVSYIGFKTCYKTKLKFLFS